MSMKAFLRVVFRASAYPETNFHETEAEAVNRTAKEVFKLDDSDINKSFNAHYLGGGDGDDSLFEVELKQEAVEKLRGHKDILMIAPPRH